MYSDDDMREAYKEGYEKGKTDGGYAKPINTKGESLLREKIRFCIAAVRRRPLTPLGESMQRVVDVRIIYDDRQDEYKRMTISQALELRHIDSITIDYRIPF